MTVVNCRMHKGHTYSCIRGYDGGTCWSEVWNGISPDPTHGEIGTDHVFGGPTYRWMPSQQSNKSPFYTCVIKRLCMVMDTTAIPVGATITQAIFKGYYYQEYTGGYTFLPDHIILYRATGIVLDNALAGYRYIRDCNIELGRFYASLVGGQETFFEVTLNSIGREAINKGGYTNIAFMLNRDISTHPPDDTWSPWIFYDSAAKKIELEITYSDVPGDLTVVTLAATEITKTTATLNGEITAGLACKRGFDWGEGEAMDNEWYEEDSYGLGTFSHDITGLTEDTEYCFRAKAEEAT